jgi:diguanylate cyclase (GGDEF)-like protein
MTEWQIAMGIVAVAWGYMICGPMRTITLQPLLLIFAFGAFALHWRRIAILTVFAVTLLGIAMLLQLRDPMRDVPAVATLPLDALNFAFMLVVLPALSLIAARLSVLRDTLRERREALARALAEVQRLATTDELTGLANRRSMIDRMVELRRQSAERFCIAIIDIDHFKRINDTLGHAQGDAVLWRLADLAGSVLPAGDVLGRWGGEEFLLLMPGATVDEARTRLEALRRSVREIRVGGQPLTFSAGIASDRHAEDLSGLVLRADRAMYRAKQEGRDAARVAD